MRARAGRRLAQRVLKLLNQRGIADVAGLLVGHVADSCGHVVSRAQNGLADR